MKKIFTAALLVTVAVGGAFVTKANNKSALVNYSYNPGTCTTITSLPDKCGSGTMICQVSGANLFEGTSCSGNVVKRHP